MKSSSAPAYVIAVLALIVAFGGGAFAATQLPKNSVGAKQLKKNSVTAKKVKNGSLLAADFKKGQLPAGPRGPAGQAVTAFRALPAITANQLVDVLVVPGIGTVQAGCQQQVGAGQPVTLRLSYTVGADDQRLIVESDGGVEPGSHVLDSGVSTGVTYNQTTSETGQVWRLHAGGSRNATFTVAAVAKEEGENRCGISVVVTGR